MSLLDRQDFLDDHEFFLFIDIVKHGITSGNMKPVYDNPTLQNQFFFVALSSREWIFFQPFQGSFEYPAGLFGKAVDLTR